MRHKAVLKIATVEKETGISKENLRIWEHRYGFPNPKRDANGERAYTLHQVEKLKLMKQLLDRGLSPKSITHDSLDVLKAHIQNLADRESKELEYKLKLILKDQDQQKIVNDINSFRKTNIGAMLDQMYGRFPLEVFLDDFLTPLLKLVGQLWAAGSLSIEAEHFFSQVVQEKLILYEKDFVPMKDKGGLLLTTPPGELHCLGLLMANLKFLNQGYNVYCLGTQTPIFNVAQIAKKEGLKIVGIGVSEAFPISKAQSYIQSLREVLPAETEIWLGGSGSKNLPISRLKNVKNLS